MRPSIPMRPEDLPQQRVAAVFELPPRPPGFQGVCEFEHKLDDSHRPESMPRSARFLATLEWAYDPDRLMAFYISANRARSHWLLWAKWLDENDWPFRWIDVLYGYAPKKGIPESVAAMYLLLDAMRYEAEDCSVRRFDLIGAEGMLTVPELLAVSRAVWPESPNS